MKLGLVGKVSVTVVVGSIVVAVALSRQSAATTARPAAPAAPPDAAQPENLKRVLDLFRSDLNASKIRTLNQAMKLTSAEAAQFWPIYQKYETELGAVDDRRIALIKQFVALSNEGQMTNDKATDISDRWLKNQQDRLDLWKKYNTEIGKAVSPIRAAQFLQVEHQIALLVDINIAMEMPRVAPPAK